MEILTAREFELRKEEIAEKIKNGAVFIHPTDTIYGIGCDATNDKAVKKIRKIKNRPTSPFSIWVPNIDWIKKNCKLETEIAKESIHLLPGKYTLILTLDNQSSIAKNVVLDKNSLGTRLPKHFLSSFFNEINLPIITTSVNKSGESFMTCLEDLDPEIRQQVDFILYLGEIKNKPSKIINCQTKEIIER